MTGKLVLKLRHGRWPLPATLAFQSTVQLFPLSPKDGYPHGGSTWEADPSQPVPRPGEELVSHLATAVFFFFQLLLIPQNCHVFLQLRSDFEITACFWAWEERSRRLKLKSFQTWREKQQHFSWLCCFLGLWLTHSSLWASYFSFVKCRSILLLWFSNFFVCFCF